MLLDVFDKTSTKGEPGHEQRREQRIAVQDKALVTIVTKDRPAPSQVEVLDISRNGMKLLSRRGLDPGTLIHIRLSSVVVFGRIRRCQPVGESFHVGVQIITHYTGSAGH